MGKRCRSARAAAGSAVVPGWSRETASSSAGPATPRPPPPRPPWPPPGHDPLRREGGAPTNPGPTRSRSSRRFKRLSAVPSAPTWRRGPRRCVLERPRTPRRAPRTPRAAPATPATAHARAEPHGGCSSWGSTRHPAGQGMHFGSARVKAVGLLPDHRPSAHPPFPPRRVSLSPAGTLRLLPSGLSLRTPAQGGPLWGSGSVASPWSATWVEGQPRPQLRSSRSCPVQLRASHLLTSGFCGSRCGVCRRLACCSPVLSL